MSNLVYQINPETSQYQGMETTSLVCPNCKTTLSNCDSRTSCLGCSQPTSPCQNCQRCLMASVPCLAAGLVPYFPLPYVCRHWLSVSSTEKNSPQPTCFHNHSCSQPLLNERVISRPHSQIEVTSANSFVSNGCPVQIDLNNSFKGEIQSSSRSDFPKINVVIPDIIFSFHGLPLSKIQQPWTVDNDKELLSKTKEDLETCGWFYGDLTWQEATAILSNTKEGTFLIRNSSSSRCLYSLSVQTSQGPTSIRIEYERGQFWLDCERKGVTPQFENIMELVLYYQQLASTSKRKTEINVQETSSGKNIWVDHKGKVFSPISINKPLIKNIPSLKHICRLSLNSKSNSKLSNELPSRLITYLSKYPYVL